ncbi:glycolipid transfer protein domain-containing protein 2 [Halichoeres trimaculatus]|uniref:glycolipid transfer protein domain-containing protein 2 n=1 Tax=Halichoeres trimaculatus TaxID=147232 RepID=UPI003D9E2FF5
MDPLRTCLSLCLSNIISLRGCFKTYSSALCMRPKELRRRSLTPFISVVTSLSSTRGDMPRKRGTISRNNYRKQSSLCQGTRTHVRLRGMKRQRQREETEKDPKLDFSMGVKSKAAAAILVLLLFLGSLWLHGGLDYHWDSCLKGYNQGNKLHQLYNSSGAEGADGLQVLQECTGQTFQVSLLLSHLLAAPADSSDVLLQPYLSSWDELVRFMNALGPMVGLISKEIQSKTSIIRQLAVLAGESPEAELAPDANSINAVSTKAGAETDPEASELPGAYHSVRSMISTELSQGVVDFHHQTDSGCRTLLRLHRALLWLKLFLEKLAETPVAGRLRSPSELCREAYQSTLALHHTWVVRRAAELAFIALPERGFFFRLVCVQNQDELSVVLNKVVKATGEVYNRTQKALEENGMLDLP